MTKTGNPTETQTCNQENPNAAATAKAIETGIIGTGPGALHRLNIANIIWFTRFGDRGPQISLGSAEPADVQI